MELSKVIPDCSNNQSKHGQVNFIIFNLSFSFNRLNYLILFYLKKKSKGGILEKTVQYLRDIKQTNQHLANHIQSLHQLRNENELLKQQV